VSLAAALLIITFGLVELTTGLSHSFFGISAAKRAITMQMIPEQG
jgi:hypothetical protein